MTNSTEVATIGGDVVAFEAAIPSAELQKQLAKEMEGLRMPPPPRIKVPSGGALVFEVPTDDPEQPESVRELKAVILAHHAVNRYYERGLDENGGESNPPDCMSFNGREGMNRHTGEIRACETCPLNKFGSGRGGVGKACSNRHRLYLLLENEPLPYILEVPPTSLTGMTNYLVNLIYRRKAASSGAVTRLTLKKAENKGGVKYSEVQFAFAGRLDPEIARATAAMGAEIERRLAEYAGTEAMQGDPDFVPADDEASEAY